MSSARGRVRRALAALASLLALGPLLALAGPDGQVVHGDPVPDGAYPFIVSVQDARRPGSGPYRDHLCGGALLDPTHVLTAAHCVAAFAANPERLDRLSVFAGATALSRNAGVRIDVSAVAVHPSYSSRRIVFDAAVLTLAAPAPIDAVATLPAAGDRGGEEPGVPVTIAGWGSIRPSGGGRQRRLHYPRGMREAGLLVVAEDRCAAEYARRGIRNLDLDASLCAGLAKRDSCYGDSGGPLFRPEGDGVLQVGIVSWGLGCGRGIPGIYTRLSDPAIADWISAQLGPKGGGRGP